MSKVFQRTGSLKPGKSVFNLSYEKKLTCDMGQLIPIMCDEVVPGDIFDIGNEVVIRFQPLVAPILHEINCYVHYFFVPNRILWDDWEEFITGGVDGDDSTAIPTWEPTTYTENSLWDYLGFPAGVDPDGLYPVDFPRRAYNTIYNEYYRDENLVTEVALTNEDILLRAWEKDYFTSALPWQQRGTSPALPISGSTSAVWTGTNIQQGEDVSGHVSVNDGSASPIMYTQLSQGVTNLIAVMNANTIDLSSASTFDVADLRLAFQIQRWMERNARAGVRYTEFLKAHFGENPRDDRLQRPEYIGGTKNPVIVSEVLQTSSTDATTPQANMAGHALTVGRNYAGRYRVKEYGLIMGIMSVMPRTLYQQGIDRQWIKSTRYDYYFPEFANLSEQAIYQGELYATGTDTENQTIFGYQGRYDELRTKKNMVVAEMRSTYDYWHLSRQFSSAPTLNETFIEASVRDDCFAAPDEPQLIVSFGNRIKAIRPLPIMSNPGLIDH